MEKADIYYALDWLSWRLFAYNRKYSQDYLDKMAEKKLREAVSSSTISMPVKVIAQNGVLAARSGEPGTADQACNDMCKHIICQAQEEDFLEMLSHTPRKITEWRKLWNAVRGNKIRRI